MLLHGGVLALQGKPDTVLDYYNALMADREGKTIRQEILDSGHVQTVSGTAEAVVAGVRLLDVEGHALEVVEVGSEVVLEVQVQVQQPIEQLVVGFLIKDRFGQAMYGINTQRLEQVIKSVQFGELLTYRFDFAMSLGPGHYSVSLSLSRQDSHLDRNYEWRDYSLVFHVVNSTRESFVGCAWLNATVAVSRPPHPQTTISSSVVVQ